MYGVHSRVYNSGTRGIVRDILIGRCSKSTIRRARRVKNGRIIRSRVRGRPRQISTKSTRPVSPPNHRFPRFHAVYAYGRVRFIISYYYYYSNGIAIPEPLLRPSSSNNYVSLRLTTSRYYTFLRFNFSSSTFPRDLHRIPTVR